MDFEAVIGLEIHVEMKTKSKMFSSAPNVFSKDPNTNVAPLDMAFPGTMPVVNKQAVIQAIRVAHALHMDIDRCLRFDRKHYFYADLAKGYQITQEFHPIGRNGYLVIDDGTGNPKKIHIAQVHLEEDTCKQLHRNDCSLLDYNRSGVPLLEVVSEPEIGSGVEARNYVEAIRNLVVFALVSDGKMEEGSLRCDINVSLRRAGETSFGTKVELKNLNSLKNLQAGIDYEIKRQKDCLFQGLPVLQETRRYDEATGTTVPMRLKTDAIDYKCFPDPNLVPVLLSESFIQDAIDTCPELYEAKKERYEALGVSPMAANVILSDPEMAAYFEEALKGKGKPRTVANFLIETIKGHLNKQGNRGKIAAVDFPAPWLSQIAALQDEGHPHQQCVEIFRHCVEEQVDPETSRKALGIEKPCGEETLILDLVKQVLEENPTSIADYKAGKGRALSFLIGNAMKRTKGKVDPAALAKVMEEEINKR